MFLPLKQSARVAEFYFLTTHFPQCDMNLINSFSVFYLYGHTGIFSPIHSIILLPVKIVFCVLSSLLL